MTTPLAALECELLEAIAQDRDDDAALGVLADYWMQTAEALRGELLQHELRDDVDSDLRLVTQADRWRRAMIAAGFDERDLTLDRCILEQPVVVDAGSALDGEPDVVRMSPRYYRRGDEISSGRDSIVYAGEAMTPRTRRRVAIKVARHPDAMAFLAREDLLLRRFDHPNLPRTYGFGIVPRTALLITGLTEHAHELLPQTHALILDWRGIDLLALLRAMREHDVQLATGVAISIMMQLCDAIAALHADGVVHTEVRPDHVLVSEAGGVTLTDFGYVDSDPALPEWVEYSRHRISPMYLDSVRLEYVSPEQARGLPLDLRTDVFSAGLVAYRLLTGVSATEGVESDLERVQRIAMTDLAPPPGTPPALAAVLLRALARDRERRYPTITMFRDELARAAGGIAVGPHVIARELVELGVPA